MKKIISLLLATIMIFSTISISMVSAGAVSVPQASTSQSEFVPKDDFALAFSRTFRSFVNYFTEIITRKPRFATGVEMETEKLEVGINNSKFLKASVVPKNCSNTNLKWYSENSNVASVNQNGYVTGNKAGQVKIYAVAEDGGFYDICNVHVKNIQKPCTDINMDAGAINVVPGSTVRRVIALSPQDTTDPISVKLSTTGVVTAKVVNNVLIVTAFAEGDALIVVACGNISKKISVTAAYPEKKGVTVSYDGCQAEGSAPVDNNIYQFGDEITILGHGNLNQKGFLFAGWNTAADGSGIHFLPKGTYTVNEDIVPTTGHITLYAMWLEYPYLTCDKETANPGNELIYNIYAVAPEDSDYFTVGSEIPECSAYVSSTGYINGVASVKDCEIEDGKFVWTFDHVKAGDEINVEFKVKINNAINVFTLETNGYIAYTYGSAPTNTVSVDVTAVNEGEFFYMYDEEYKTLTVYGCGELNYGDAAYDEDNLAPWHDLDIERVVLKDGITAVKGHTFSHMALKSASISSTVKEIDFANNFYGVKEKYIVNEKNPYYSTDEYFAIYNKDKTILYKTPSHLPTNRDFTEYTMPDSVTRLEPESICYSNIRINVSGNVNHIGERAFWMPSHVHFGPTTSSAGIQQIPDIWFFQHPSSVSVDENNAHFYTDSYVLYSKDKTTAYWAILGFTELGEYDYFPETETIRDHFIDVNEEYYTLGVFVTFENDPSDYSREVFIGEMMVPLHKTLTEEDIAAFAANKGYEFIKIEENTIPSTPIDREDYRVVVTTKAKPATVVVKYQVGEEKKIYTTTVPAFEPITPEALSEEMCEKLNLAYVFFVGGRYPDSAEPGVTYTYEADALEPAK